MQHEDLIITTTDMRQVSEDGKRKVLFRVQIPGRVTEGQESGYDANELGRLLRSWDTAAVSLSAAIKVGQILGDALFPAGLVRDTLLASLAAHKNQADSRLRLILNLSRELQSLPWEFMLLHTEQGEATQNEMLGLMSQVSIVRQLDRTMPDLKGIKAASTPLSMVMALADPSQKLDLEGERQIVAQSLGQSRWVTVTYVPSVSAETLLGGLEQVLLFHFAGHGSFIEQPTPGASVGRSALLLEDGAGGGALLEAPLLATRLVNAGVRVAVLGACLTAKHDDVNLWSSTAANLINGGIGAVVAMQYTVLDASAIAFTKAFYEALALGFPVDQAVTRGRLAIFEREDFRGCGAPVLYMGASDGVLFPEFTNDPALAAEREKIHVVVNLSADTVAGEVVGIKVGKMSKGEARVKISVIRIEEGGKTIGLKSDALLGGDVDVDVSTGTVDKGGTLIGFLADSIGRYDDIPSAADATRAAPMGIGPLPKGPHPEPRPGP